MKEAIATIRGEISLAKLEPLGLDLSKADAAAETTRRFPDLDVLVNKLGVYEPKPFEEISDEDWTSIIETNFMSGVRLSRHYLPRMKSAGWGRVIFISSESAVNIPVEMIHYGVTKTMQLALARGLAETTADRCDGQLGFGGSDPFRRRRRLHRRFGQSQNSHACRSGKGILHDCSTKFAAAAFCHT